MADVLYIASAEDVATKMWDLYDRTGLVNPYGVKTDVRGFSPGHAMVPQLLSKGVGRDGSILLDNRQDHIEMTFTQALEAPDSDSLFKGMGELFRMLQLPNQVMVRRFDGEPESTYYDLIAADPDTIFRGDPEDMRQAIQFDREKVGLDLRILRQPWRRGSVIDSSLNLALNSTLLLWSLVPSKPAGWSIPGTGMVWTQEVDEQAAQVVTPNDALQYLLYYQAPAVAGETFTMAGDMRLVSGVTGQVRLQLQFLDAALANLSIVTGTPYLGSTWFRPTLTATAPATTAWVRGTFRLDDTGAGSIRTARFRRAQLELGSVASPYRASSQIVMNDNRDLGGIFMPIHILGDMPAEVETKITVDTGGKITFVGYASKWNQGRFGGNKIAPIPRICGIRLDLSAGGWTSAIGTSTTIVSGAARVSLSGTYKRWISRVSVIRTVDLDTLRGGWEVLVRVKANQARAWRIGLAWGPQTSFSVNSLPYQVLLQEGDATSTYQWLSLGDIFLPPGRPLNGLRLEVFAALDETPSSGTPIVTLDIRDMLLIPRAHRAKVNSKLGTDAQRYVNHTDFKTPSTGVGGESMLTATQQQNGVYQLQTVNSSVGIESQPLPPGAWDVKFGLRATVVGDRVLTRARVRIVDVTTTPVEIRGATIEWYDTKGLKEKTLSFESEAGHFYEFQYKLLSNTTGLQVRVSDIVRTGIALVGATQSIVTKPGIGALYQDTNNAFLGFLRSRGDTPFILDPGTHIAAFWFGELTAPGDNLPNANPARDPTVGYSYSPRYFG